MNKIFLVIQREFMSRVKKRSFLLATILVPLVFPAIIIGMIYVKQQSEENKEQEVIQVLNESDLISFEDSEKYKYVPVSGPLDSAKASFTRSGDFALLYVPLITPEDPVGISFYAKTSPGINLMRSFERNIASQLRDEKLTIAGLTDEQLDQLKTDVYISLYDLSEAGDEKKSDSMVTSALGYITGSLIYIFLFAYGTQVMQGVIEEKGSQVVEVIVSTVKPFHMMIGKVVGVASVGIVQFAIWIILVGVVWIIAGAIPGLDLSQTQGAEFSSVRGDSSNDILGIIYGINWIRIAFIFLFYFLGGYLLYGALFAAVGSAVDTPADAQQFMMPIMLPIIVSFMGLSLFVFEEPHGTPSFWLSMIPFTSPIVMMGRIGFGVPTWEITLSMVLLIGGFIFTLWLAGRIYRIGILMHGTKVNYKVLAKWFMMKN
ncbi:MAG: ABC transporter permease [Ekhidna sp.]|nr:ABC transporter permease [Ekhidna sp.]